MSNQRMSISYHHATIRCERQTIQLLSDYKIIRADDGFFNVLIDGRQTYRTDTIDDAYYNMYLMQQAEKQQIEATRHLQPALSTL